MNGSIKNIKRAARADFFKATLYRLFAQGWDEDDGFMGADACKMLPPCGTINAVLGLNVSAETQESSLHVIIMDDDGSTSEILIADCESFLFYEVAEGVLWLDMLESAIRKVMTLGEMSMMAPALKGAQCLDGMGVSATVV